MSFPFCHKTSITQLMMRIKRENHEVGCQKTRIQYHCHWGGSTSCVQPCGLDEFLPTSEGGEFILESEGMGMQTLYLGLVKSGLIICAVLSLPRGLPKLPSQHASPGNPPRTQSRLLLLGRDSPLRYPCPSHGFRCPSPKTHTWPRCQRRVRVSHN